MEGRYRHPQHNKRTHGNTVKRGCEKENSIAHNMLARARLSVLLGYTQKQKEMRKIKIKKGEK